MVLKEEDKKTFLKKLHFKTIFMLNNIDKRKVFYTLLHVTSKVLRHIYLQLT